MPVLQNEELLRTPRASLRMRDAEWDKVERALEVCLERPSEFARTAVLERAQRVLARTDRRKTA